MSTSTKILGTLPVNRTFVEGNTYYKDNIVQYNGSSYICSVTETTALPTDSTAWRLFAGDGKSRSVINISTSYNNTSEPQVLTVEEAIALVPDEDKVIGFVGTILTPDGWTTLQYQGETLEDWDNTDNWKYLVESAISQELGDDETKIMSQKAVTDEVNISTLGNFIGVNKNIKIKRIDAYLLAFVDSKDNLLGGIQADGKWFIPYGIPEEVAAELRDIKNRLDFGEAVYKIVENENWMFAIMDSNDKVLMGYTEAGGWYIPNGIPEDTKKELRSIRGVIADHYQELRTELTEEINERKSFLHSMDSSDYLWALTDADSNIIFAAKKDGSIYQPKGVPEEVHTLVNALVDRIVGLENTVQTKSLDRLLMAVADSEGKQVFGITTDGNTEIAGNIESSNGMSMKVEDNEVGHIISIVDKDKKMVAAIQEDGKIIQGDKFNVGSNTAGIKESETDADSLYHIVDKDGKVLFNITREGITSVSNGIIVDGANAGIKINRKDLDYLMAVLDSNDNLLAAIDNKGALFANSITGVFEATVEDNDEWLFAFEDRNGNILFGVKTDGSFYTTSVEIDGIPDTIEDMEFVYVILDKNKKVLFGITNTGRVYYKSGMSEEVRKKFSDIDVAIDEFHAAINNFHGGTGDWSDASDLQIPIPKCAMVNFIVGTLPTAKSGIGTIGINCDIPCQMEFWDMQGNYFKKWIKMSAQGNSSLAFVKKNFAIDIYLDKQNMIDEDESFPIKFGDWVSQDSFHLKAYYTDTIRGKGTCSYRLYEQMVKTRPINDDRPFKQEYLPANYTAKSDNGVDSITDMKVNFETGAKCFPMGFPVIVYHNGVFHGVYAWQLKKHRDNFMMDKKTAEHIHLDGTLGADSIFGGTINWAEFEVRNPKSLKMQEYQTIRGEETISYNGDYPKEIMGTDSEFYDSKNKDMRRTAQVKEMIINLSNYIPTLRALETSLADAADKDEQMRAKISEFFKVSFMIDYILETNLVSDGDGYNKNWQWTTWDGVQWTANPYDHDGIIGAYHIGNYVSAPSSGWLGNSKLIPSGWIITYFLPELKARWKELRDAKIFDTDNVTSIFRDWINSIGYDNWKKEYTKWNESPCNRKSYINSEYWTRSASYAIDWAATTTYAINAIASYSGKVYKSLVDNNIGNVPNEENSTYWQDITWDSEREYNVNEVVYYSSYGADADPSSSFAKGGSTFYGFKCLQTCTNEPPITKFYNAYPRELGHYDNIYRMRNWIEQRIAYMDTMLSYSAN